MRSTESDILLFTERLMDDDLYPLQGRSIDFSVAEYRVNASLTSSTSLLDDAAKERIYMKFLDNYEVVLEKNAALQQNKPFLEHDSEILMQNDLENATARARSSLKALRFTQILKDIAETTILPKEVRNRLEKRLNFK